MRASQVGIKVLETDALVVWALQGDGYRLSSIGGLVHELKKLLAENFVVYQVQYMPLENVIL